MLRPSQTCDQIRSRKSRILCSCIQEMLPDMFKYPPLIKACGKWLISFCRNFFACIFHGRNRTRKFRNTALLKNVFVVYNTEIISLNCHTIASISIRRALHGCCHGVKHGFCQRLAGQIIGILLISINLFSGSRGENIRVSPEFNFAFNSVG